MKLYVAPMEGITGYIFRNAFNEYFGQGVDSFFTPFLTPCEKVSLAAKDIRQILPENNMGINLIPQVITANGDDFNMVRDKIRQYGYEEVNINLGCPSRTVVSKGRGSGALADLDSLKHLLDRIFEDGDKNVSIKTRIGVCEPEEFEKIMDIYREYPIRELTIHPRVTQEMYKGTPHRDIFIRAAKNSPFPICYNGDINTVKDYVNLIADMKQADVRLESVMIGRGILSNPSLIREISAYVQWVEAPELEVSEQVSSEWSKRIQEVHFAEQEIRGFLCKLREDYLSEFSGERPVLFKLKEVWTYLKSSFPDQDKSFKKLMKSKSIQEYRIVEEQIIREAYNR